MLRLLLLLALLFPSSASAQAIEDRAVPGGWWYSQTAVVGELGFAVVDDAQARFYSEFRRLGGVGALGYPSSQRFELDGFTVQATQRVLMQWRPEANAVYFVNVFDRLHDLGQDGWLRSTRQTPEPRAFDDAGKPWPEVVRNHLAVLEPFPALKTAFNGVPGDPVEINGLPVSDVVDVGNHHALRAQRVVFQLWKVDVPWARAGQVTVALGGDIAKEAGLVPAPATRPSTPTGTTAPSANPTPPPGQSGATPVAAGTGGTPPPGAPSATPGSPASPPSAGQSPSLPTSPAPATVAPSPGNSQPSPPPPGEPTSPLSVPAARFLLAPSDLQGSRVVEDLPLPTGHKRILIRDSAQPHRNLVVGSQVDLFRDPAAAIAAFQADQRANWASPEPGTRLESVPGAPRYGDDSVLFRVVAGDSAGRGFLFLFRRVNAVGHLYALSQVTPPTLDELSFLAKIAVERVG